MSQRRQFGQAAVNLVTEQPYDDEIPARWPGGPDHRGDDKIDPKKMYLNCIEKEFTK